MRSCVPCRVHVLVVPTAPVRPLLRPLNFCVSFLEHCAHQKNFVTGEIGSRLDFIAFHPKGSPTWESDHVRMGIAHQLRRDRRGFQDCGVVSGMATYTHSSGRVRPRRLRCLFRQEQPPEFLSERPLVRGLHGGGARQDLWVSRKRSHQLSRRGDVGL